MPKYIDLRGERFGKLTVIERAGVDSRGERLWLCECDCGNTAIASTSVLRGNRKKSCGCLYAEAVRGNAYKHGKAYSRIYREWRNMKYRCRNPNSSSYAWYGGRGIQVCDRWLKFETFYDDVSMLPHFGDPNYTLDRIDGDGNYEPGNVRWADKFTQANNRNSNMMITYNGETHSLAEWSRKLDINYNTLKSRLRLGWPVERVFTTKKQTIPRENSNHYYERKK